MDNNTAKINFKDLVSFTEKHSLVLALVFFVLGIIITAWAQSLGTFISGAIEFLISFYGYFVPFILYFLLTPALIGIIELAKEYGNGWLFSVLKQFIVARTLAVIFVISILSIIFDLPFYLNGSATFGGALAETVNQLIHALVFSTFLYGVYAAIITIFIARKFAWVKSFFNKVGNGIEYAGESLVVLTPLFMFAIGSFLYHLPFYLEMSMGEGFQLGGQDIFSLLNLNVPGINFVSAQLAGIQSAFAYSNLNISGVGLFSKQFVFIKLYFFIGLMTGLLCLIWHGLYVMYTRMVNKKFNVRYYINNYWLKIYPLLWSSSSESLAVPLSLSLMKKKFPEVPSGIRQFVIAGGSYLGINGTIISVYVMGVILAVILGVQISFLQLLFSLPVIFILGYAVPGIPGELIIFAGSMGVLLGIPENILPLFLALYLTLQIGLPDSFRTGCNSTDSALVAIISSSQLEFHQKQKRIGG